MQRFRYKLLDANQKPRTGKVEAPSREAAIQKLSKNGCVVTELELSQGGLGLPPGLKRFLPLLGGGLLVALVCVLVIPSAVAGRRVKLQRQQTQLVALMKKGDLPALTRGLEEQGYDLNQPLKDGSFLLHLAVRAERAEVVSLFLSNGAEVSVEDGHGSTPLHHSAVLEDEEISDLLIRAGADLSARDEVGNTPLHLASEWGRLGQVRLLLKNGASTALQNEAGETVLHSAVESGESEVLGLLLDAGAEVNAADELQRTVLHRAASYGERDFAELLLERGADPGLRDQDGKLAAELTDDVDLRTLLNPH